MTAMTDAVNTRNGPGKIHLLPGEVISRIAAGEVVERPAAVVKELIDNSLDAGSTTITVEVSEGGLRLIKVTDDGEGMGRADAGLAFRRHATSKVRAEEDLWSIQTLGFRGEALASISAVSKVRLVTASRQEPVGTRLLLTGGTLTKMEEVAAAPGTEVEVADLFFNTPARRKFLKSTATEFSHICQMVQQAALAWPRTQFRLRHNGQEVCDYAPASSHRDRVLQVYGPRFLDQMVEARAERPGLRVEGFAVNPVQTRAGRTPQDLFVNGRPIRNGTVSHAVYDAYGPALARGRHPRFVLFLEIDPERVDVNVHPTKREVRFANQDLVHQAVRQAVKDALAEPLSRVEGPGWPGRGSAEVDRSHRGSPSGVVQQGSLLIPPNGDAAGISPAGGDRSEADAARESSAAYQSGPGADVIPFGQISRTFLVAQVDSELQVIDQHTAHERVLFERLWRAWLGRSVASQALLIPEPVELPPHQAMLLQRHLADLEKLGLEIEPFGSSAFLIRAVPALLGTLDHAALVQDLLDDMAQWNAVSTLETRVRAVLASLACHGAVRAGRAMELPEVKRLIEDWVGEGLPMTCPHGRRVALRLPGGELARIFGRT